MINNYIFDFGQVIVSFDPLYMTGVYIEDKDDRDTVAAVVFDRLYWDRLDEGTITDGEVVKAVCSRLPERLRDKACLVYENWYKNLPFIDGVPELIRDIKSTGGKLYLLSNISKGFSENYRNIPGLKAVLDLFDGIVFSGDIALVKPDVRIFEHLLKKYGLRAEDCVFIDDSPKNIAGAKNAGIEGHLFDGDTKKLRSFLLGK